MKYTSERPEKPVNLQNDLDFYQILTNNIPGFSLFLFDKDLRFIIAEGSDLKNFGLNSDDFAGKTLYELPDEVIKRIWIPLFRSALNRKKTITEYLYKTFNYQITVLPVPENSKGTGLFIALNRNITERKKSIQRLKKSKEDAENAKKAIIDFLAWVSHEIRTPLNSIIGFTEQLLQTRLDTRQEEYIKIIDESSEHLMLLINDVLALSKIESGQIHLDHIPFKIRDIVENLYKSFIQRANDKKLGFARYIDEKLDRVLIGDPLRLRQVLNNLLNNAFKFTENGFVSIKCMFEDQSESSVFVRFEITDTGIGISKKDQKKVFQKFSQVEPSVSSKYGGTGLGLTICRNLVNLLKGRISVSSKLGSGTTINCLIPFKKGEETDMFFSGRQIIDREILNKKKILLVDDDNFNRLLAKLMLEKFNCSFDIAASGKEAVGWLERKKYDVVLLDMRMPGMKGIEVAEYLRKHKNDNSTKIVAVTASALKKELLDFYDSGINDFLIKPFRETDLFGKICKVLEIKEYTYEPARAEIVLKEEIISQPYSISDLKLITAGNENLTKKMLKIFVRNSEKAINELKQMLKKENWNEIGETAHKLISSFRHLKADHIVSDLMKIEAKTIIEPDHETVPGLIDSVVMKINELIEKLRKDNDF